MSLHEWSMRLELYTVEDILSGAVEKWERGIPGKKVRCDLHKTYPTARAYDLIDPIMRLYYIIIVSNVGGMSMAFSKMPRTNVYFISRIMAGTQPQGDRQYTVFAPDTLHHHRQTSVRKLRFLKHIVPSYRRSSITTPHIRHQMPKESRHYQGGRGGLRVLFTWKALKDVKDETGVSGKKLKSIEKRLGRLEQHTDGMTKIEKMIVDLRKSQLQALMTLNDSH